MEEGRTSSITHSVRVASLRSGCYARVFHSSLPFIFGLLFVVALNVRPGHAQSVAPDSAYRVYTERGEQATLDTVVAAMDSVDVVFIGEVHDDSTGHALHQELMRRAHRRYGRDGSGDHRSVALSLEMFERDVQPVLDEYLEGLITEEHFLTNSRPWSNYHTAYRPLVEYAKEHGLDVLAANAPRRYVNRVARRGPSSLNDLSHAAKQWLPPLPVPGPSEAYRAKWEARMQAAQTDVDSSDVHPHGSDTTAAPDSSHARGAHHGASMNNMLHAQTLWDATMAHTIATHLMNTPDALVLHLTGVFHVSESTGTPEQLAHYRPSVRPLVIVIRPVGDIDVFDAAEHDGLGDFVILTDAAHVSAPVPAEPGN